MWNLRKEVEAGSQWHREVSWNYWFFLSSNDKEENGIFLSLLFLAHNDVVTSSIIQYRQRQISLNTFPAFFCHSAKQHFHELGDKV